MNGTKPPYKVPTMREIANIPWNGYNVVSTFSGGGGSCLGYEMAGYRVLWANEFVEEAQKTYRLNHPKTYLDCRDIRTVTPEDILAKIGLKKGELDLFDGSPPCCAFSDCGKKEKGWGQERKYSDGKRQTIEDLFEEYIRILDGLKPKVFVAENVTGLVKGSGIGFFKHYYREMEECGYDVQARIVYAKWLGVPQDRRRCIFIGVRKDLGLTPVYPKPYDYIYGQKDALEGVQNPQDELDMLYAEMERNKIGKVARLIPTNPIKRWNGSDVMGKGRWFNLNRSPYDWPASTVVANTHMILHPLEARTFTIAELKRIQSVPDDFVVTGKWNQKWERLGRMVPPVMMMNIAKTIEKEILDKAKEC